MKKILIVGIGGVGGYYGGLLAKAFKEDDQVAVYFMARGAHLEKIKEEGLLVTRTEDSFQAYPRIASDKPEDFGPVDYIILSTKSYDLASTIAALAPCIHKDTVLLPLLNGVDSVEILKQSFQDNLVAYGCTYIIGRLVAPGHVQDFGKVRRIVFGDPGTGATDPRLQWLDETFKRASIDSVLAPDVLSRIWQKFIFISAMATASSYFDRSYGGLQDAPACSKELQLLIKECKAVALKKGIGLPEDIEETLWRQFTTHIPDSTTSMHADYLAGKDNTEVESLTGYVVRAAEHLGVEVPTYKKMYAGLMERR